MAQITDTIVAHAFHISEAQAFVAFEQVAERHHGIPRDDVRERPGDAGIPIDTGADTFFDGGGKGEGRTQHQERCFEGRIVYIDEAKMDLSLVAKARTQQGRRGPVDQGDCVPGVFQDESRAHSLDASAENQNAFAHDHQTSIRGEPRGATLETDPLDD